MQGSVTSSIIGWFAGFDGAQEDYGTGLGPGEGCEGLDFVNDGGVDGINSEGVSVHVLEIGQDVSRYDIIPMSYNSSNLFVPSLFI